MNRFIVKPNKTIKEMLNRNTLDLTLGGIGSGSAYALEIEKDKDYLLIVDDSIDINDVAESRLFNDCRFDVIRSSKY